MKKRAERFGDQLGNNENLNLDEKKKKFGKGKVDGKLNRALGNGNKRILGNRLKNSNNRRNLRNRKFEGVRKIRGNRVNGNGKGNANVNSNGNRVGFRTRRGGNRRLRGMNRNFNN